MAEKTKTLRVTQVRSKIGHPKDQGETLHALGLHHINDFADHEDTPSIRGMIHKVQHLVKVEEI